MKNNQEQQKNIFISGSIDIKKLPKIIEKLFDKFIAKNYKILVGDANGVDSLAQKYFKNKNYSNLIVYFVGDAPRNNHGNFQTKYINYKKTEEYQELKEKEREKIDKYDGRSRQKFKDAAMTEDSDGCLCIWDGRSEGAKNNITRALEKMEKEHMDIDKNIEICYIESAMKEGGILEINYDKARFLKDQDKNKEKIIKIFESNTGIIYNEVKKRFQEKMKEIYSNQNITENELGFLKRTDKNLFNDFEKISKVNLKYIKTTFKERIIPTYYKGKESSPKYHPDILKDLEEKFKIIVERIFKEIHTSSTMSFGF